MANINETISEVAKLNPELARRIQKYVKDHSYGLVFEHNLPEAVRLYKKQPAIGDTVNILAPRGQKETEENSVPWCVKYIDNGIAYLEHDGEAKDVPLEDICVLVSYRDVIYPGLKEIDRVERGNPEDPYHMVINSENYHALEALTYAYAGKVNCIYIDPPYNGQQKDWKYNNDYVSPDDQYKHSKWLAFMERRLKLAKQLLNPKESVLIVTIDEKEYLRLGLLLEQMFFDAKISMVSSVINPYGTQRLNEFNRVDEYIFFVMFGESHPLGIVKANSGMSNNFWKTFRRGDLASRRGSVKGGKSQFYPIYVDEASLQIMKIGESIPPEVDRSSVPQMDGCFAVFPIRDDGTEMNWCVKKESCEELLKQGYLRAGKLNNKTQQKYPISYLRSGTIADIENGKLIVTGRNKDGSINAHYIEEKEQMPATNWRIPEHSARDYGTNLIGKIFIDKRFIFPKSLYAVHDCLNLFVKNNPNALIVDFFAGSGTTLHAVNLLNAEDGGHRRCICVTNNEVSEAEEKKFVADGLRPSDPDWEKYGIANYVTWPRTVCSIEGHDVNGKPLEGDYGKPSKDIDLGYSLPKADGFKANAVFCELTYESAWPIRLDNAFNAIAPILWMQAGCQGSIIRKIGKSYLTTDYYGVLFDYGQASKFCEKVKNTPTIKTVFVVTDDQRRYSNMCKRLPGIEVHRLYETFLRTFEICGEGGLD